MNPEAWSLRQNHGSLKTCEQGVSRRSSIYSNLLADPRKENGGDLNTRRGVKSNGRKRYGSIERRGQIKNRISIGKRPAIVDLRSRIGDWEADTVIATGTLSLIVNAG